MELDVFKVLLRHTEDISGVGEEDITSVTILSHILIFAFFEVVEFFLIVALYPASLIQVYRFPTATGIVLVLQTVLDNFKLKLTNCSDDLAAVELVDKQLCPYIQSFIKQTK